MARDQNKKKTRSIVERYNASVYHYHLIIKKSLLNITEETLRSFFYQLPQTLIALAVYIFLNLVINRSLLTIPQIVRFGGLLHAANLSGRVVRLWITNKINKVLKK